MRTIFFLLTLASLAWFSPAAAQSGAEADAAAVRRFVASGNAVPAWARTPGMDGMLAVEAESHGLASLAPATLGGDPGPRNLLMALHLARALAVGAVGPGSVEPDWTIPVAGFDDQAALEKLASLDDPMPWLRALAPRSEDYRRLQRALAVYRAFARGGGWAALPDGPLLKPGMADDRVPLLRARLTAEGYLAGAPAANAIFDGSTEQALRRFQGFHGLAQDGRLGRATLAALNVTALERSRQITANLERWRWLPHVLPDHRIVVNAAAARLALIEDNETVLELRTIVGAKRHPTPVLMARIVSLLFNPPWDIPRSIVAKEIRPHARRDPGYLAREGIVPHGDGGLRQLPGPKNALGRVKFEMPNPMDVYLHDTPQKRLFERVPRFFSHGCIRLEHPEALALILLGRGPAAAAAIEQGIASGETRRVPIAPTLPIYVLYFTAAAEADGSVAFYDDLYGRDPPLIAALEANAAPSPPRRTALLADVGCGAC